MKVCVLVKRMCCNCKVVKCEGVVCVICSDFKYK